MLWLQTTRSYDQGLYSMHESYNLVKEQGWRADQRWIKKDLLQMEISRAWESILIVTQLLYASLRGSKERHKSVIGKMQENWTRHAILRHIVEKGSNVTTVKGMTIGQVIVIDQQMLKLQVEEIYIKTSRIHLGELHETCTCPVRYHLREHLLWR